MTWFLQILSGRPGSNWRHSAWKADALPTELLPLIKNKNTYFFTEGKCIAFLDNPKLNHHFFYHTDSFLCKVYFKH